MINGKFCTGLSDPYKLYERLSGREKLIFFLFFDIIIIEIKREDGELCIVLII
jgi:hypothetical protein